MPRAHEDAHPSLSISIGEEGRVLVRCHAGCGTDEIVAAAGLVIGDLFESEANGTAPTTTRRPPAFRAEPVERYADVLLRNTRALEKLEKLRGWTAEACERLGLGLGLDFDSGRVVFPYRDAAGALVGVGRYQPNPDRRNGSPKVLAAPGSRRELFPAPETLETSEPVWLVEGEPDAVRGTSLGLAAVAVPGVQAWRPAWAPRFKGRSVVVCMDCDQPGREAAQRIAADLSGTASEARVLDLKPDRDDGFDLTDFANGARTAEECEAIRHRLMSKAAELQTLPSPPASPAAEVATCGKRRRVYSVAASDVARAQIEWLLSGQIPFGYLSLLIG